MGFEMTVQELITMLTDINAPDATIMFEELYSYNNGPWEITGVLYDGDMARLTNEEIS